MWGKRVHLCRNRRMRVNVITTVATIACVGVASVGLRAALRASDEGSTATQLTDIPMSAAHPWNVFSVDRRSWTQRFWTHVPLCGSSGHVTQWNERTPHGNAAPGVYRGMALVDPVDDRVLSSINYQWSGDLSNTADTPLHTLVNGRLVGVPAGVPV